MSGARSFEQSFAVSIFWPASPRLRVRAPRRGVFPARSLCIVLPCAFAVAALLLAGCAPAPPPTREPREILARDLLARMSARADTVRTVRGSGRLLVTQGGATFEAKHRVLYERPDHFRVDIEAKPLLGLFEARWVALANGDTISLYSPSQGILFEGSSPEDLDALGPELRWVAMSGAGDLLVGLPGPGARASPGGRLRVGEGGKYEISLDDGAGVRILWVDPVTFSVDRMEIRDGNGGRVLSSEYEYRDDPARTLARVKVQYPLKNAVLSMTYREFLVNGKVDPAEFEVEVPDTVRRFGAPR